MTPSISDNVLLLYRVSHFIYYLAECRYVECRSDKGSITLAKFTALSLVKPLVAVAVMTPATNKI